VDRNPRFTEQLTLIDESFSISDDESFLQYDVLGCVARIMQMYITVHTIELLLVLKFMSKQI